MANKRNPFKLPIIASVFQKAAKQFSPEVAEQFPEFIKEFGHLTIDQFKDLVKQAEIQNPELAAKLDRYSD